MATSSSRTVPFALAVLAVLGSGCLHRGHSVKKYRDDPMLASQIEARAEERCLSSEAVRPPRKFVTDGCSAWPDGTWGDCCVEHDMAYWCGGSAEVRRQADLQLRQCVSERVAPWLGAVMYYGVRAGGPPWLPTPWRWAYGWPWLRGYTDSAR